MIQAEGRADGLCKGPEAGTARCLAGAERLGLVEVAGDDSRGRQSQAAGSFRGLWESEFYSQNCRQLLALRGAQGGVGQAVGGYESGVGGEVCSEI